MRTATILRTLLSVAVFCATKAPATAEDLNPPTWRGTENTCRAAWEFGDDLNPGWADAWYGPGPAPQASVQGYPSWYEMYDGRYGAWLTPEIVFELDNYPDSGRGKQFRVQVIWVPA